MCRFCLSLIVIVHIKKVDVHWNWNIRFFLIGTDFLLYFSLYFFQSKIFGNHLTIFIQ